MCFKKWHFELGKSPAMGVALGAIAGVFCAEGSIFLGLVAGSVGGMVLCLRGWNQAWILSFLFVMGGLYIRHEGALKIQSEMRSKIGEEMQRNGVVKRCLASGGGIIEGGGVLWMQKLPDDFLPGDRVMMEGHITLFTQPRNPGEQDWRKWLEKQGIGAVFKGELRRLENQSWDKRFFVHRWAEVQRRWVRSALTNGVKTEEAKAIILGVFLGEKAKEFDWDSFRVTGVMHAFAVSGLHIGLVAALIWGVLYCLGVRWRSSLLIVAVVMTGYALISGFRPPVQRALLMGLLVIGGFLTRRPVHLMNLLGLSVPIVLMYDSFQLYQMSFQLSYLVLCSIGVLGAYLYKAIEGIGEADPFLPRYLIPRWKKIWYMFLKRGAQTGSISLAAWIGSAPLIAVFFQICSPIGVLVTLCVMPFISVILGLSFLSIGLSLCSPVGSQMINQCNSVVAQTCYRIVQGAEQIPWGYWEWRGEQEKDEQVIIFDLPYGGACSYLFGTRVLVDIGGKRAYWETLRGAFASLGVDPELLVISHADAMHCGGGVYWLQESDEKLKGAIMPVEKARSPRYQELVEELNRKGVQIWSRQTEQGRALGQRFGLEVIWPLSSQVWSLADEHGVVIRYTYNGWKVLFVGDLGMEQEFSLVDRGVDLSAEVLVMGRSLSDYSGTSRFIQAVSPTVVIASDAFYPEGERVPIFFQKYLKNKGVTLLRQSQTGGIRLFLEKENLRIQPFLPSSTLRERTLIFKKSSDQ